MSTLTATIERPDTNPLLATLPKKFRARERFFCVHYEESWEYAYDTDPEEGEFLPQISEVAWTRAVNGVDPQGGPAKLQAGITDKGGTIIWPHNPRLGEYQNYLASLPTATGGKHFIFKWQKVDVLRNGSVLWNDDESHREWRRFRQVIRDQQVIPPMRRNVFSILRARAQARVNDLLKRVAGNPHLQPRLEREEATLRGMDAAWSRIEREAMKDGEAQTLTPAAESMEHLAPPLPGSAPSSSSATVSGAADGGGASSRRRRKTNA